MSKNKKKKTIGHKVLAVVKVFFILILIGGLIGGALSLYMVRSALSDIDPIDPSQINNLLVENSVILDSDGNKLEDLNQDGLRTIIKYEDMNENLINAYVAIEDKTFFEHSGFNIIRMAGAIRDSLISDARIQGTSTITQQLARNLYLFQIRSERSIDRKIKEAYYSIQLEKYLTKEQIIEAYLNTIYLGSNSKGVEAASDKYFSKKAKDLSLEESAILAGIPKSPTKYTPMYVVRSENVDPEDIVIGKENEQYTYIYNKDCEERYKLVLYLMKTNGYINEAEYSQAIEQNIIDLLQPSSSKGSEISSYFSDMVEAEVIDDLMEKYEYSREEASNFLYTSGLSIHSTIDFDMQKTLESAYAHQTFTTYFGQPAKNAVIDFQRDHSLKVDGVAGNETFSKLIEIGALDENEIESSSLSLGNNNADVEKLKRALNALDYFSSNDLYPKIKVYFNGDGNIVSEENRSVVLISRENTINDDDELIIEADEFFYDDTGNLVLEKNEKLNFYPQYIDGELDRIQVVVKNLFTYDETDGRISRNSDGSYLVSELYTYQGRDLLMPSEYKSLDENGNVVISSEFLNSDQNIFNLKDNNIYVPKESYVVDDDGVIQPQSAMVVIDYHTGHLKAVVGGRNTSGQKIYNRALNPRQPGSSVKPLAVYSPAIESGRFTAASVIDDIPTYLSGNPDRRWPINWYENYSGYAYKYWGISTLREGIEQSMNVVTAKLANKVGVERGIESLKEFGISTIVEDGPTNDMNLSAVSLGGMTKGIEPIELAEAYGTFGNDGVRIETITYTHVTDSSGETLLDNTPEKYSVIPENVAFILRDMLRTAAINGGPRRAQIKQNNQGIPIAGKTGTTSSNYDAWFTGFSPYYVGTTWFGTDYNMPLDSGSRISAEFWGYVMKNIHEDLPNKDFAVSPNVVEMNVDTKSGKLPSSLSYMDPRNTVKSEYFIPGTQPTELDDVHVQVEICKESGLLATEYCPTTLVQTRVMTTRLDGPYNPSEHLDSRGNPIYIQDQQYTAPTEECDIHGEIIDVFDYEVRDSDRFIVYFPDKKGVVVNPFKITLTNNNEVLLPVRTKIMFTGSVILPDNSVIEAADIKEIPYYYEGLEKFLNRNSGDTNEEDLDTENTN